MLPTYRATLTNGHIEWDDKPPDERRPVRVMITILEPADMETGQSNGPAMAAALKEIADRGGVGIGDPAEWQREIRKDRPLPGRED